MRLAVSGRLDGGRAVTPDGPVEVLAGDDELDAAQLTTMDSLWHARRDDGVSEVEAAEVERLVRLGRLGSARHRLGVVRRAARERDEP